MSLWPRHSQTSLGEDGTVLQSGSQFLLDVEDAARIITQLNIFCLLNLLVCRVLLVGSVAPSSRHPHASPFPSLLPAATRGGAGRTQLGGIRV